MRERSGKGSSGEASSGRSEAGGKQRRLANRVRAVVVSALVLLVSSLATTWVRDGPRALGATPANYVAEQAATREISVPPPAEMTRADVYIWSVTPDPLAVVVLCPGFNGDGRFLLRDQAWQEFARENHLALCAVSFASSGEVLQSWRGYYQAARGSGEVLLSGVRRAFGRDLPLFLYGFSGGAHFTASFVNWRPERVLGWCADSPAWWEEPSARPAALPVGIVACGDMDAGHYGASLTFFDQGRALGRPWTWMSLGGLGHARSEELERFVRAYFAVLLRNASAPPRDRDGRAISGVTTRPEGCWLDVDTKEAVSDRQAALRPTSASWLPDRSLAPLWSRTHCP